MLKVKKKQRFPLIGLILFLIFMAFYVITDNSQNQFFPFIAAITVLVLVFIIAPIFLITMARRSGVNNFISHLASPAKTFHAQSLAEMQKMTPAEFEHFVGSLFQKQGYNVRVTGKTGDNGIDIELISNSNGEQKRSVVQCKRYKGSVGESIVREFYGSFAGAAEQGYLITTGTFTEPAKKWVRNRPLILIDGHELVRWATRVTQPTTEKSGVV